MISEKAIDILDDNFTVIDTHGHFSDEEVEEARQMAIKALKQEPFINKPCVSSGVCEYDKQKILDKIRAEIDHVTEIHSDGEFYIKNFDVKRIIDKYKYREREVEDETKH